MVYLRRMGMQGKERPFEDFAAIKVNGNVFRIDVVMMLLLDWSL